MVTWGGVGVRRGYLRLHFEVGRRLFTCVTSGKITYYNLSYNKRNYKINAKIIFDTNIKKRPLIKKLNATTICFYDDTAQISRKILLNKQFISIKENTREVFIQPINKDNLNYILTDLQLDLFPYFDYTANFYLDSLFCPNFNSEFMDMKNISYEVTTDTACLNGDCYLVKISAPSFLGTEIPNDTNDETTVIYFKMENNYFWINKKTYFPERFRREWTLQNDSLGYYDDYRFTKIEKNHTINDAEIVFNKKLHNNYRIEEQTSKGIVTTQEAFFRAPNIKGVSSKGDNINLYQNQSKLYLIDFWFSNCPACMAAKAFIESEIISKYNNPDILVISVNPIDKSFEAVKKILKENTPLYPYILNKDAAIQYHLSAYPGIYMLNDKFEVIRSFNTFNKRVQQEILQIVKTNIK